MFRSRAVAALFAITLALAVSPMAYAQATGSINGTVTDATGAAVVGAKVTVSALATGLTREATSDEAGHFLVTLLPVANFTVRVEMTGFQAAEAKDIRLQVDESRELDFKLSPASVSTNVEVTATEVAIQTTNATLGQVINSQQVAELPLNGRDFVQLATLTPGATQETNPNSFFNGGASSETSARGSYSLSVGGSRASSTDWLLDGNDNNELTAGGIAILPSIDAIQEFKVLTFNYSAEWGTRAGPTVLVTTKSGSNQIHGSLFEFFRNTDLDARSFFATTTEQFNLNQFGGSVGGPIKKDKIFFFADIEQKDQRHGIPFTGLVPTAAMRTGNFTDDPFGNPTAPGSVLNPDTGTALQCAPNGTPLPVSPNGSQATGTPCNIIPAGLIDPVSQKLINLYPLPNAANQALDYNYVSEPVRKLNEGKFDIRLDDNLSSKDSLFARFSYDQAVSYVPGGAPGFAEEAPFASNQNIINHARNVAVSETHVFSEKTVNQFNAGYNRIFDYITSQGSGTCEAEKLGIPGANLGGESCGLTSIDVLGGYWSLGDRGYTPFQGGTNVFSISDSFDMIRGGHDIKIGGGIRANQMNVLAEGFQDGFFVFGPFITGNAMGDLLTGYDVAAVHDQTFDGDVTGRRWKLFRPFIEDDWRVSKSLTVNLGLAWALVTPVTEAHDRLADFNPANGQYLIAGQGASASAGIQMDMTALEPRIGVAWKPWGSQRTAIRGGYAIFHDSSWNQGGQGLWQNPPYYAESDGSAFTGETPSTGFPIITSPPSYATFPGTLIAQNLNFKQGRVQQFNINIEHQFGGILLTAGYAGSRSSHILVDGNNLDVGSPSACGGVVPGYTLGCGPGGASFGLPYPNIVSTYVENQTDTGQAHYNSLQIKAETKSKGGLYALLGYTYSRTYDNGMTDGVGTPLGAMYYPLPGWQNLDWGLSQINLNNSFIGSVIYELPFGKGKHWGSSWSGPVNAVLGNWELDAIEKVTSGFPVFIIDSDNSSGVNFENDGNSFMRPNQVCNPTLSNPTLSEWFNTSCFAAPPAGEIGNAKRAPVSGPDFVNTDMSLIKHFVLPWREGLRLDFRAECFNLFNHPQFGLPVQAATGYADFNAPATFGVISSTVNNPRLLQLALKIAF